MSLDVGKRPLGEVAPQLRTTALQEMDSPPSLLAHSALG